MKRNTVFHLVFAAVALLWLHGTTVTAQQLDDMLPGIVLVKFEQGKLARLSQEIDTTDMLLPQVKSLMKDYGFKAARKVFRRATPSDTAAVSLTGQQVKLKDVSHWYVLKIEDTTNISDLVKKL